MSWPWSELGLSGPSGLTEIRRAYAKRLESCHPEEDPEGFQRLHSAYQAACRQARQGGRQTPPPQTPEMEPSPPEPPQAPVFQENPQEPDWDYERLLAEGFSEEASDSLKKPETDWDYERLFAEGAAEAQEARRRKLEELRRKNRDRYAAQEAEQRRRSSDEEEAWAAVMAATHALELLYTSGAELPVWRRFLNSPVFWNARSNLDFVFALEDFIEQNPDLPREVRKAFFEAYGFEKGVGRPEYRRLYQLLGVGRKERQKLRRKRRPSQSKTQKTIRFAATLWLLVLIVIGVGSVLVGSIREIAGRFASTPWEEQCLAWLSEDLGREFIRPFPEKSFRYSEKKDPQNSNDYVKACVYAPADSPDEYFFAFQDGERSPEQGALGYQSNYADRLVMTSLTDLAEEWDLGLDYDSAPDGFQGNLGETPGAYLFQLPLTGAGEFIPALGARLDALKHEDWYQKNPPEFEVFLCYGDLNFYSNVSTVRDFDADYARSVYENKFGPNVCRYIAEESGVAAEDLGEDAYVLIERGTVQINGETFFWVSALEKPPSQTALAHYFLEESGTSLFCITPEMLDSGLSQEELHREMYKGGTELRTVESLGVHRRILVWDRIKN